MDVLNDRFFEQNAPVRPLPDEDYDKNGKLRNVRGRILKKLLKYEFKAYLMPMLIATSVLFAVAIALCVLGCFMTTEDFSGDGEELRVIFWILSLLLFICGLAFIMIFPIVLASKRYQKQFFSAEGYLTLSIPASAQEHILAKRIAGYVAVAVSSVLAVIALVIALIPIVVLAAKNGGIVIDPEPSAAANGWDIVYTLLQSLISPLIALAVCGGFICWRHRGLKNWMIGLLVAGVYVLSTVINVFLGGIIFTIPADVLSLIGEIARWVFLAVELGALYLLFLYETQTLRKKINLK